VVSIQKEAKTSAPVVWLGEDPGIEQAAFSHFLAKDAATLSVQPLEYQNTPEDPAHILFTSGSTGIPKGVVIKHSNVTAFVDWALPYFGTAPEDRISCHPPLHFDLSTFDIFGTFTAGAALHLVPQELNLNPLKLAEFIRNSELTQWFSVPAVLSYLARFNINVQFPSLRRVLWCGEALPVPTLIYWMKQIPSVTFTNLYGPTETTIASSYYTVPNCPDDARASIPIGTPCDGEKLFVLDDNREQVKSGDIGELYIGGVGLSPGYWRDPEKTKSAFLQNPQTGELVYKTGDLARVDEYGLVHLLGRVDSQIKHRGYRIELGEVETALNSLRILDECAVVAIPSAGFESTTICCAYVPKATPVNPTEIRTQLARLIPSYMLPSRWRSFSAELPKNINGKIDRPLLRALFRDETKATNSGTMADVAA